MYETVSNCFLMRFMFHNEIHSPLGAGYNPVKIKQGLRSQMHFSHTNYSPQISALTWTISPLNPESFSHETSFSLYMPLTHCISISVQALTPKLNLSPLTALKIRLVTLTTPTHKRAFNSQHSRLSYTRSESKQPSLPEVSLLQGESSIF